MKLCQVYIHPYTMIFLINFLILKCHADIRYETCRLLILHKIIDPGAGLVENLWSYRCLWVCLVQSYNQFGYDGPSRYIKFILKETGFWNQLPRSIRLVRVSANQRVYWQTQHWFLNVYNLPDSSIPDQIWWISMWRPPALVISTTKLASFITWWLCSTSAASVQTYWTSIYTANLIWDQILNPI